MESHRLTQQMPNYRVILSEQRESKAASLTAAGGG